MPSACAPSRSPCSRRRLRPRVGKCSTVSIPTCSWTSRQAAQALIRIFAIGESATSIASAPASRSVLAAATSCAALNERGGSISTVTTNAPAAERAPERGRRPPRRSAHDDRGPTSTATGAAPAR